MSMATHAAHRRRTAATPRAHDLPLDARHRSGESAVGFRHVTQYRHIGSRRHRHPGSTDRAAPRTSADECAGGQTMGALCSQTGRSPTGAGSGGRQRRGGGTVPEDGTSTVSSGTSRANPSSSVASSEPGVLAARLAR